MIFLRFSYNYTDFFTYAANISYGILANYELLGLCVPQITLHFHSYLRLHLPTKLTPTDTQKAYIYIQWAQRVCRIYALFVHLCIF